jgi:flagellar biosynthesis protein
MTAKKDEKIRMAAALKYEPAKDQVPVLAAKGRGLVAEKIIEIARKNSIPIKEDPNLVQILSKLEIDEQIPPVLYKAVAEILAFVYSLNERVREEKFPDHNYLPICGIRKNARQAPIAPGRMASLSYT